MSKNPKATEIDVPNDDDCTRRPAKHGGWVSNLVCNNRACAQVHLKKDLSKRYNYYPVEDFAAQLFSTLVFQLTEVYFSARIYDISIAFSQIQK